VLDFSPPVSSCLTSFFLAIFSSFFACYQHVEVFIRKLKLSSSIAVALQVLQAAIVSYHFPSLFFLDMIQYFTD
jgi:hypothetical protein